MKIQNKVYFLALALAAVTVIPACKAKKPLVQPPTTNTPTPEPVQAAPKPMPEQKPEPVEQPASAAAPKPNYSFSNIQFEFNSAVLKTSAYLILDKAAGEMKKDVSVKFVLNGYASAEGTAEHNLSLSAERANAVKTYLVNGGINGDNLVAKGFGEANPVSENTDESGRALNRRVEIKKQ